MKSFHFSISNLTIHLIHCALKAVILSCILLCTFSACRQSSAPQNKEALNANSLTEPVAFDLGQLKERGTLVALVDNSSTSYFVYKGQPMGYEYELLTRLAKDLGLKLQLKVVKDIQEAFTMLNNGEGDLLAYNLTVTKERKKYVAFTEHHSLSRQVLVQRKPQGWQKLKLHELEKQLIRNPIYLAGKDVWARDGSAHVERLQHLSNEVGDEIKIRKMPSDVSMERLIAMVADNTIKIAVADENVALVNATYYPSIDVNTPISFSQKIAWAVRKNSPDLLQATNNWIRKMRKEIDYYVIYNKYFKNRKASRRRVKSQYFSHNSSSELSPYDDLIKKAATDLEWDWRLLASQMYQESRFDPEAESWAGAKGLMQLMPATGNQYGAEDLLSPQQNVQAATAYLNWLDKLWSRRIEDPEERKKFVLASYNVGQGHVIDACKLARKYGKKSTLWEGHVREFLLKKSQPKFFKDPVVSSGYCRGHEPVRYVDQVLLRYEQYAELYKGNAEELYSEVQGAP